MAGILLKFIFWATPGITDIDRRECKRTVPMEVLVLGKSRTGTSSIRQGLKDLGYNETYHAGCVYKENPRDSEMWVAAMQAKFSGKGKPFGREEFDQLLGHCMAVTDVPCLHFMEELLDAYPNAKVVLTMRDSPAAWLKSVKTTLIPMAQKHVGTSLLQRVYRAFLPSLPFQKMNEEMMQIGDGLEAFYKVSEKDYVEHNEKVRKLVAEREEKLRGQGLNVPAGSTILEFNVKQGFVPLCEFLGRTVPKDADGKVAPFPRLNDAQSFNDTLTKLTWTMHLLVAINVAMTAAGLWGAVKGGQWALARYA